MLSQIMMAMKYTLCKAYHDVWYRPAVKPNGFEYNEYVLIFVEDIINKKWARIRYTLSLCVV